MMERLLQKQKERKKQQSPNFFLKFKQKVSNKFQNKANKNRKISEDKIVELKCDFKWNEFTRKIDFSMFDCGNLNEFERFFIESFGFANAFNEKMVESVGEEFLQSIFCVPVFVAKFAHAQLRAPLNLERNPPTTKQGKDNGHEKEARGNRLRVSRKMFVRSRNPQTNLTRRVFLPKAQKKAQVL